MRNDINEAHDAEEDIYSSGSDESKKRKVVVPGEVIVSGEDYLPGEGAKRLGENIISIRFGLAEELGRVIKVIPIFGAFVPRRNNVIIGRVTDITFYGWLLDIDSASSAFLPIEESPRFVNKNEMEQFLAIGDVVSAMINLIKDKTGCQITVGQNGWIWIKGDNVDAEIKARKAIEFVTDKVHIEGLTDKVEKWFEENK